MNASMQKWVMEKNLYPTSTFPLPKTNLHGNFLLVLENSLWSHYMGPLLLIEYTAINLRPWLSFYFAFKYLKFFYLHFLFPSSILTSHLYNFPSKHSCVSISSQVCVLPVPSHKLLPNSIAKSACLLTRNLLFYFYCFF